MMLPTHQDIGRALQALSDRPAVAALAVLSLVLGIAPTTVVFSLIEAAGFRPLPIPDPAGLVAVYAGTRTGANQPLSYLEYLDVHQQVSAFSSVGASTTSGAALGGDGRSSQIVIGASVNGAYFSTLGVRPALGRFITEVDDPGTGAPVIVIGHRLWTRRYGADPRIVGRTVRVNDTVCRIVGVAPEGFAGTTPVLAPEFWTPGAPSGQGVTGPPSAARDRQHQLQYAVVARLREGATIQQARGELDALGRRLAESNPDTHRDVTLHAAFEQSLRRRLPALVGSAALVIVGLVLLTACANVAGLLLGRGEARRAEIAVRLALGAGRWRIIGQLLAEGLVLSAVAAAGAALVTWWLIRLIPSLLPALPMDLAIDLRLDLRLLAFTAIVATISVPACALAPALVASRVDLTPVLKGESVPVGPWRSLSLQNALVAGQVTVTVVLLVSLGLMVRSLTASRSIDPGFTSRPMLFAVLAPEVVGYTPARTRDFYDRLLARLRGMPGVERAALARHVPLNSQFGSGVYQRIEIPGRRAPTGQDAVRVRSNLIDADFLATVGTPIVGGRGFTAADGPTRPLVVLVNQKMAVDFWSGQSAVGQSLWLIDDSGRRQHATVAGVVRNAKYNSLTEALTPHLYLPFSQHFAGEMSVIIRVAGDERAMVASLRRAIEAIEPSMPTLQIMTFAEHVRMARFSERMAVGGAAVLGGIGLLLSVVGLHGVVARLVVRKTREIGIRMALGANADDVRRHVMGQSGRLVLMGLAVGVVLALGVAHVIASTVHGVRAADPLAFAGAIVVVAIAALAASWRPAARAARLDPVAAFRRDPTL